MKKRLTALIAVTIACSAPLSACGSDDEGTDERASAAVKAELLDCLKRAKIRVVPSGKVDVEVIGRVPRVAVPAEYLGVAVLPSGGFYDLWLAGDPDTAEAAAEDLNEALARELDRKPQIPASRDLAAPEGPAVSAVGGNVQVGSYPEVLAFLRCLKRL